MGFILHPKQGESLSVNAWNWRPTLELIWSQGLITSGNYELMGIQLGVGGVDADTALRIATMVEAKLEGMRNGSRMLADLTVTDRPKVPVVFTPDMNSADVDSNDLYSATYEWLVMFRDFCRSSGGFEVF